MQKCFWLAMALLGLAGTDTARAEQPVPFRREIIDVPGDLFKMTEPRIRFAIKDGIYGDSDTDTLASRAIFAKETAEFHNSGFCFRELSASLFAEVRSGRAPELEALFKAVRERFGKDASVTLTYTADEFWLHIDFDVTMRIDSPEFQKYVPGMRYIEITLEDFADATASTSKNRVKAPGLNLMCHPRLAGLAEKVRDGVFGENANMLNEKMRAKFIRGLLKSNLDPKDMEWLWNVSPEPVLPHVGNPAR